MSAYAKMDPVIVYLYNFRNNYFLHAEIFTWKVDLWSFFFTSEKKIHKPTFQEKISVNYTGC